MPYLTEGKTGDVFKALFNLAKDGISDKAAKIDNKYSGLRSSSIMRASKDLVMTFPVLCSDTIQPSTAAMITKAIERNCTTQLQMLFSASYLQGKNGQEVLKMWHNNIDNNLGMDDYLAFMDEYVPAISKLSESVIPSDIVKDIIEEAKRPGTYYPDSFSESSIADYEVKGSVNGVDVKHVVKEDLDTAKFEYQKSRDIDIDIFEREKHAYQRGYNSDKMAFEREKLGFEKGKHMYQQGKDAAEFNYKAQNDANKAAFDREKFERELELQKIKTKQANRNDRENLELSKKKFGYQQGRDALADRHDYLKSQLTDNDVKKCNELVPTMIIVRYMALSGKADQPGIQQEFIAGVKAKLYTSTMEEIIEKISSAFTTRVNMLNWHRATTGEIKFAKDFVAGVSQAKIDAKRASRLSKSSPLWRSLQYRSSKSGLNRLLKKNHSNNAGAITTLVITKEEVNTIAKEINVDLRNPKNACFLMEMYNFMGLVIIDEDFEVASFIFDGDNYFQDVHFNQLEREANDKSYKQVVNLISKLNR